MHQYSPLAHFHWPKMDEQKNNILQKQQKPRRPIPCIPSHSFLGILFAALLLLIISKCSATISNLSHQSTGSDQQLHQNAQNGIQSSHSSGHNLRFQHSLSFGKQREEKNLFREYLSRAMFTCTEKYVSILIKLNKLIASAHQEYSQCQGQIAATAGQSAEESKKLASQLEMINELFGHEQ